MSLLRGNKVVRTVTNCYILCRIARFLVCGAMILITVSTIFKTQSISSISIEINIMNESKMTLKNPLTSLTHEIRNMTKSNPIYRRFNVEHVDAVLRRVDLFLLVSSGPGRVERRDAIRKTWWKECVNTKRITLACFFVTDAVNNQSKFHLQLQRERKYHGDILFQPLSGGVEFGYRC
ncbi:uncharacterized protein [Clytia hemisphaerica]|uniref:Hexosyltransferase n=1 Tax=Clytia hemisphaerica TaxID=252671 RepID=A0A7M5UBU9_9CNID